MFAPPPELALTCLDADYRPNVLHFRECTLFIPGSTLGTINEQIESFLQHALGKKAPKNKVRVEECLPCE